MLDKGKLETMANELDQELIQLVERYENLGFDDLEIVMTVSFIALMGLHAAVKNNQNFELAIETVTTPTTKF